MTKRSSQAGRLGLIAFAVLGGLLVLFRDKLRPRGLSAVGPNVVGGAGAFSGQGVDPKAGPNPAQKPDPHVGPSAGQKRDPKAGPTPGQKADPHAGPAKDGEVEQ